jgi:hypothetical protein
MANKGLQFEKCIMYLAMSTGYLKEKEYDSKVGEFLLDWQKSPNEVRLAASNAMRGIFNKCNARTFDQKKTLCKTFKKMSGGIEPKTDIMFINSSKKYKCSLKYGDSFQLSSAGIEKTNEFLTKVINKVAKDMGKNSLQSLGEMVMILEQIDGVIGGTVKAEASVIQSKLSQLQGVQFALQQILGSKTQPDVGESYVDFKRVAIRECLTGELTFGPRSDFTANYILEGPTFALHKITPEYVNKVMSKSSVRIAAKGRGKIEGGGGEIVRYQEASIRFDVKS